MPEQRNAGETGAANESTRGRVAGAGEGGTVAPAAATDVTHTVQYRGMLHAPRRQAFDALVRAVDVLHYRRAGVDTDAGEVRFQAMACTVTARVEGRGPRRSAILVEFTSLRWRGVGGSAVIILPGVFLGSIVKAQEAYFARGFINNVQRVLEGRPAGRDSARVPLLTALRRTLEIPTE